METKTETNKSQNVEQFLTESMKNNPNSGEITLEQIERQTKLDRADVVKQLRALKSEGKYIVGRKGHKSRFIWGEKLNEITKPISSPRSHNSRSHSANNGVGNGFSLQLQVGEGEKINIPVKLELVH